MELEVDLSGFRETGARPFTIAEAVTRIDRLYENKKEYREILSAQRKELDELQNLMYAHNRYALLLVFQAMDAAGKDGTIRRVLSGVNPHGVEIHAFKRPSEEELDHDFLWRTNRRLPARGRIGVFNRSYYEEVIVVRVHPEIVTDVQRLPSEEIQDLDQLWEGRYEDIRHVEQYATRNGIHILKFFLHLSRDEQARRLLSRIDEPAKNWKFEPQDLAARAQWGDYMKAYELAIRSTATQAAPWYVIPADDKRNMRLLVAAAILEKMRSLEMHYPQDSKNRRKELQGYADQLREELA